MFGKCLGTFLLGIALLPLAAEEGEYKTINPNLSGPALPQEIVIPKNAAGEKWIASNGILHSPDHSNGSMSSIELYREPCENFELEFRLRCLKQNPKDQHFGFGFRKQFTVYSRGSKMLYLSKTRHAGIGVDFPEKLVPGENSKWTNFSFTLNGSKLIVKVDGKTVAEENRIPAGAGKITFYSYGIFLEMKDLSIKIFTDGKRKMKKENEKSSPNIALNSSFEQTTLDKLPDYWGVHHWGLCENKWVLNHAEWIRRFHTDSTTAYHGKRSMRIENPEDKPVDLSHVLWSCTFGTKKNNTYTLSAWMKSDRPGVKVRLSTCGRTEHTPVICELSPEWKRYSMTFRQIASHGYYSDMMTFAVQNRGTVWIDAVQLEEGDKATEYQPANVDRSMIVNEGNGSKPLYEVPEYKIPLLKKTPVLTGTLSDPVWKDLPAYELKSVSGKPVREKSFAKIFYTPDGIVIGIDATESDVRATRTERDDFVWNDSSFELFLDSKLTRGIYHHLSFNANGVQYDDYLRNAVWNGSWKVKTARKSGGWTAEVFIPFCDMNIDAVNSDRWGFNLGRYNPRTGESSCLAPTYGSFHSPLRFGQLIIDPDVQKKFFAGLKDFKLTFFEHGKYELSALAFNRTGKKRNATLRCSVNGAILERHVAISDKAEIPVNFGIVSGSPDSPFKIDASFSENERPLWLGSAYPAPAQVLNVVTMLNYCTSEKEQPVQVKIGLSSEQRKNALLEVFVNGKPFRSGIPCSADKIEFKLPVESWNNGEYSVVCRLMKDGKELGRSESKFKKLPPGKVVEVKVDRLRRVTLVDGKPFIPLGLIWEDLPSPEVLKMLSENNINFIHLYLKPSSEFFKAAERYGIRIGLSIGVPKAELNEKPLKVIENYKKWNSIISWETYDEVFTLKWGMDHVPLVLKNVVECQAADPYRFVNIVENRYGFVFLQKRNIPFPGSVVYVDDYAWTPTANVQMMDIMTQNMMKIGESEGQPSWLAPFVSGYGFHASRDMTPDELEYQSYIAVINGVRGLIYWANVPKAPSAFRALSRIFGEIKQIQNVLLSLEEVPEVSVMSTDIRYTVKKYHGEIYLITVNDSRNPVKTRFNLNSVPGAKTAEVMFENRTIPVKNGILSDEWSGLRRHVYRIK